MTMQAECMNQRYDLLAISLLFFSVVLAIWLGIGGPQGFALKDWQPLIASFVALGAATLAYKSAMAKVEIDRAEHRREFLRRQLALYLKLDIAIEGFRPEVQTVDARLVFLDEGDAIPAKELRIKEPLEIAEAWENLDVFPRTLIREIAMIRACIRRLDEILNEVPDDRPLRGNAMQKDTRLNLIHTKVSAIVDACGLIASGLEPEIDRLAPPIPEQERMLALYGEPDYGED
jgi:hypothetical protein